MQDVYRQFPLYRTAAILVFPIFLFSFSPLQAQQTRKGVVRIKVTEALAAQLESQNASRSATGDVVTGIQSIDQRNRQFKVRRFTRVFPPAGKHEAQHRKYGLHLWYSATMDESIPVSAMIQSYQSDKQILKIEPVYEKTIVGSGNKAFGPIRVSDEADAALPAASDDPLLSSQWHYHNTGQTGGTPGADIKLFEAWKTETGSNNVIVAVTDGGIQVDHPDLAANLWTNAGEVAGNGIDDDNNGYIDDLHGYGFVNSSADILPDDHGTHVAGTIAAVNNNGLGVAGIAGGSGNGDGVRLMSCAVFSNGASDGFAQAYVYSADNGAVVSQNSWGYTMPGAYEQVVIDAIDYFIAEAGKDTNGKQTGPMNGGLVIFSAGNSNDERAYYPAAYEPVLTVTSTTHKDVRAQYANYGSWVDIAAPGGETYENEAEGVVSTLTGGQYGAFMGTSMACPHVSGVAALILSHYDKEGLRPETLAKKLLQSVDNIDANNPAYAGKLGSGRLNARLALHEDDANPPEAISDLRVLKNETGALTLAWTTPEDPGDVVAGYDLRYATTPITDANFTEARTAVNVPIPAEPGSAASYTFVNLPGGVLFYFAIRATDFAGNVSAISNVVQKTSAETPAITIDQTRVQASLKTAERTTRTFSIANKGKGLLTFGLHQAGDEHQFANATPMQGTVKPGQTQMITVSLDAAGLFTGTYQQQLVVAHNDPQQDAITLPIVLQVTNNGAPIARVTPAEVEFKSAVIGTVTKRAIGIYNDGSDALTVTSIISDSPDYSSPAVTPIIVQPFHRVDVTLHFSPHAVGLTAGKISIHTDDPSHPVLTVSLHGEGLKASPVTGSPASFSETLPEGSNVLRTLVLQNNGEQDRNFRLAVVNNRLVASDQLRNARTRPTEVAASLSDSLRLRQQRLRKELAAHLDRRPEQAQALAMAVTIAGSQKSPADPAARTSQTSGAELAAYHTNFDKFPVGPLGAEGWSTTHPWVVAANNPHSGSRHLRAISEVTGTPENVTLSPYLFEYDAYYTYPHYTTTTMRVNAEKAAGATWEIVPQDPWSYVATRIRFLPDGSIAALVIDNDYNMLWKDVAAETPSGYFDLAIEYNNWGSDTSAFPTYDLFINNEKVFSGTGLAPGIGQVAFIGAMEAAGPTLDVDDFSLAGAEYIPQFLKPLSTDGVLHPGQAINIPLKFDAVGMKYGSYEAELIVYLDESDSLVVPAALTVTGAGAIITDVPYVHMEVNKGETVTQLMTLTNTGGTPVQFTFSAETELQGLEIRPASGTIPVRGEQLVTIEFAAPPGLYERDIILATDIPGSEPLHTPFDAVVFQTETLFSAPDAVTFQVRSGVLSTEIITLHNDGKNPVSFNTTTGVVPWIAVDPASATFGPPALDMNFTVDARALAPGTYTTTVGFTTNDLHAPDHTLQITLDVLHNATGTGRISWEKWTGIPGTNLSDIPVNSAPAVTGLLTEFAAPSNAGDQYGNRIRGFIHPPVDGFYTFYIASNDHSALWLSTNESEGNKRMIASVSGYTNPLQWNKYASQTSARIYLEANQRYYIEALHKEGVGSDHLAVGWQLPDGTLERPVQGLRLSAFESAPLCHASGTISREYWSDITGSSVSDIPLSSPPDGVERLTTFESRGNIGSHYGARIRGYICPPATGDYYFWLASNDQSELWLSTDDDPANKVRVAFVSGATGVREWEKSASQKSVAIPLTKGRTYYVEALHKQGVGSDHFAVGWQLPDGTLERPMRGDYLSPFVDASSLGKAVAQSFNDSGEQPRLQAFPNPVRGENLNISIGNFSSNETASATVEVRQLTGTTVFTKRITCRGGCDLQIPVAATFTPGVYILQVGLGQQVLTEKLIVP